MSSIYFIRCKATGFVKIGRSISPLKRMADLQVSSPGELELLGVEPGGEARERELHARFADQRVRGEWFIASGALLAHIAPLDVPARTRKTAATSPTLLAAAVGIGKAHACQIMSGKTTPSVPLALRILRETGLRLGFVIGRSDEEIAVLEKMHG